MVSLQAEGNYWYHFPEDPVIAYGSGSGSGNVNYQTYQTYSTPPLTLPVHINSSFNAISNSFTLAYSSYTKRFTSDSYCTLFVPLTSPHMDQLLDALQTYNSPDSTDTLMRVHIQSEIEGLLQTHMCRYMYLPTQLRNHVRMENLTMTRIDYENGCLQNDPSNKIESYQLLEKQAIYFISHELAYEGPSNPFATDLDQMAIPK